MKTKRNYVLASLAIVTGIGTAFASTLAPVNPFVRVKPNSSSTEYVCRPSGASCESSGVVACRVRITTTIPGSGGAKTVNGHTTNACSTVLTDNSGVVQVGSISVYDAID